MTSDPAAALRARLAALTPAQRHALEQRMLATGPAPAPDPVPEAAPEHVPDRFPLTDVQQAYWAGRARGFELGGVSTHSYCEIDSDGIDVARLETAWNRLIARHAMLRAVIHADGSQQILDAVPPYRIAVTDLAGCPAEAAERHCAGVRDRMSHQVLALDRWPLFEICATRLDAGRVRLHLSFDAIIADLSSRAMLMREWEHLYRGADLPPVTESFARFALEEQAAQGSQAFVRALDYWMARLDTLPDAPALPRGDPRAGGEPPRFTRRSIAIDAAGWSRLEGLARAIGVTANCLMLTAYADVLRLWSGSDRFTLNLTLFNRPADGSMAGVVGDFTALTLLETGGSAGSFGDRARALQAQLWRDLDHRAFNGVRVSRALAQRRGRPGAALMPVVFTSALDGEAGDPQAWLGRPGFSVSQTPQVWIDLIVTRAEDGIACHWNSVDALFPPGMMADMVGAFERLLAHLGTAAFGADATWPAIAALLLPPEHRALYQAVNATAAPVDPVPIHLPWRAHSATGRVAVIARDGTLSHADLATRTAALAARVRQAGAAPDDRIAIAVRRGWAQVAAPLAVLEAGCAYLPLDPAWPVARIAGAMADAGARMVVTDAATDTAIAWPPGITRVRADLPADAPVGPPAGNGGAIPDPSSLAYVIYTSGSSGRPKGVAIDHRGAANTIADITARFGIGADDRVLALSALSFDLSVYDIFGVLGAGGAVVLPDPERALDPAHWAALIRDHGVTLWNTVPALMELLVDYAAVDPRGFPTLRNILLSGDRIPTELPRAIHAIAPAAAITSLGGATEASIWSIAYPIDPHARFETSIPYGKPLRNQSFRVVGPGDVDRPLWVPGALLIGGDGLAMGYFNDPAATQRAFVGSGEARCYRTGDLGRYLPDGTIAFLGRDDDQIKLNGFRIELGEVEAALAAHPGVKAAAVTLSDSGSRAARLIAHIVPHAGPVAPDELAHHLRARLPRAMIPTAFETVAALPLTANGKIDRRALSQAAPTPPAPAAPRDHGDVLPTLRRMVRDIAGIDAPADANLLDHGMTSVEIIRTINAVEAAFGVRPDMRDFYASPTLDWLAGQCADRPRAQLPATVIADPAERAAFKRRRAERHRIADDAAPLRLDTTAPAALAPLLAPLLARRHSVRRFTLRPVTMSALAGLLAVLRRGEAGAPYGSAGDSWAVEPCLVVRPGRVAGLAGGSYRYDPLHHSLTALDAARPLIPAAFAAHNAPIVDEAAFVLLLVADLDGIEPLYGDQSARLAAIEAGLMTQTLDLAAPLLGLGLCQLGGVAADAAATALNLSPRQRVIHVIAGGEPDAAAPGPDIPDEPARLARMIDRIERLDDAAVRALLDGMRGDG